MLSSARALVSRNLAADQRTCALVRNSQFVIGLVCINDFNIHNITILMIYYCFS